MVRAWFMDSSETDQRQPHHLVPDQPVSLEYLETLGVCCYKFDAETYTTDSSYQSFRQKGGYNYQDEITCCEDTLQDYKVKLKAFFTEHIHKDDEVRYIIDGSGYFDVRDKDDRWIRIECVKDDLITIPAGIYHRFTLDTKNYIKAVRLFVGEPVWTPFNRPADDHVARLAYLKAQTTA